jgi:hypothetical protein
MENHASIGCRKSPAYLSRLAHRAAMAFRAIRLRCAGVNAALRARLPSTAISCTVIGFFFFMILGYSPVSMICNSRYHAWL